MHLAAPTVVDCFGVQQSHAGKMADASRAQRRPDLGVGSCTGRQGKCHYREADDAETATSGDANQDVSGVCGHDTHGWLLSQVVGVLRTQSL